MKIYGVPRGWLGTNLFLLVALLLVTVTSGGCGYNLSPTPYSLLESIRVSVPMATNQSRYGNLGPQLTANVINRLDASTNISIRENAAATLKMNITSVDVPGGSWDPDFDEDNLPVRSASRVIVITVVAILERPNPQGGQPLVRRQAFTSQRSFLVGNNQVQVEFKQGEAFDWIILDLGQKITQTMFSEF